MKNKLFPTRWTLQSILISSILLINTLVIPTSFAESLKPIKQVVSKTVTPQATITSSFNQGGGYQIGKYELTAIQPTTTNWTRQTRFLLGDDPEVKWRSNVGNSMEISIGNSSPVIGADGTIYVRSDGFLKAIDENGKEKWALPVGAEGGSSPVIAADGTLYIGTNRAYNFQNNGVYGVNPDGTLKFFYETGYGIITSPSIGSDGTIYVLDKFGTLYAIYPNGMKKWTFETRFSPSYSTAPVIGKDGTIYIVVAGSIFTINPNGEMIGRIAIYYGDAVLSTPTIGEDGTIYLLGSGGLFAISPDGSRKWSRSLENNTPNPGAPVIATDGIIYVYDQEKLYAFLSDGSMKWSIPVKVNSLPILGIDGTIYLTSNIPSSLPNSEHTAIEAYSSNGKSLWLTSIGDSVDFNIPLAIKNETIYAFASDGYLYSFGTSDVIPPDLPIVNDVTDQSLAVTGKAEAGCTITVKSGETIVATGVVSQDESYSIPISRIKAGTQLSIVATDAAGNSSEEATTIVIDVTSPALPTVNEVTDQTTNISGKAEPYSTINVKSGLTLLGKTTVNDNGSFIVSIEKQKAGTKLMITSTDQSGNASEANEIVVKDTTKPIIIGVNDTQINIGEVFDGLKGVTAEDSFDGNLTDYIRVFGTIDNSRPNTSTLTYIVSDKSGNKTSLSRKITVIDNIKPKILGALTKTIAIDSIFDEYDGVYAYDNVDEELSENIKVSGSVDTKKKGEYILTYTVSDIAGNVATVTRKISVIDNVKPVFTGTTNETITIGNKFNTRAGVAATDNVDSDLTKNIEVTGFVNTNVTGTYTLTYTVSDTSGNVVTVTRKITVIDNIRPVISGATNKNANMNSTFNPLTGVTAKDNIDGDLSKQIKVNGSVNTKKKGLYTLTYTVSDKAGNKTVVVRKITVKDLTKPVIYGAINKTIKLNSSFNVRSGVTAKDNIDGDLTKSIKISGSVNTEKKGTYIITYTVKDRTGNTKIVYRKVIVK
ncbi:hypothetical protein CN692_07685 [Bacillus sp. AFS002410]|uniref:immunoglobulin-like domain-containing protein n=1 Tax=Bacillus sp. AFS002410 TaxID=2033481 RepID=UPI000BF0256A|nr:immunoglobulin-like domain-containing protein [Bacillus sp. AFS002410]PEJ58847.1 hypothetical protein CN692_07685 [Bacillus sp. AFS002410]